MPKSMLQEVNIDVGIGNGCSRPVGKDVESLVLLQTSNVSFQQNLTTVLNGIYIVRFSNITTVLSPICKPIHQVIRIPLQEA